MPEREGLTDWRFWRCKVDRETPVQSSNSIGVQAYCAPPALGARHMLCTPFVLHTIFGGRRLLCTQWVLVQFTCTYLLSTPAHRLQYPANAVRYGTNKGFEPATGAVS